MKKNEVATVDQFMIATGRENMDAADLAEFDDEFGDLDDNTIPYKTIKMPGSGGRTFEIETEDPENPDTPKEFEGVLLFTHRINVRWQYSYADAPDGNNVPACSSFDGKEGVIRETGEICSCDHCQYNEFAADGSGKACDNKRRLYLLLSGQPDLYVLTIPPTSMRDFNMQLKRIMGRSTPYSRLVLKFRLAKAKSRAGIDYSKLQVERVGSLPPELYPVTKAMREEIKNGYTKIGVEENDVAAPTEADGFTSVPDANGFVNVPQGNDEELPFA